MGLIDGRILVGVLENFVFTVAVGAERSLGNSLCQGFAVHAVPKLVDHFAVA